MSIENLKEQARKLEQREEWSKALDLYRKAIDRQGETDEPDIALHHRIGDLQVRLDNLDGALDSYEQAIALYLENDLPNNAVAVCRKMLRHAPEREATFLRLGQIRARQGFVVDARQNFLTYAEMMGARGETDEAFRAMEELVTLVPSDLDTRLFLSERLAVAGRREEALAHLEDAHRRLVRSGDEERLDLVRARIHDLDPDVSFDDAPAGSRPGREPGLGEGDGVPGFESTTIEDALEESAFEPLDVDFSDISFDAAGDAEDDEDEEPHPVGETELEIAGGRAGPARGPAGDEPGEGEESDLVLEGESHDEEDGEEADDPFAGLELGEIESPDEDPLPFLDLDAPSEEGVGEGDSAADAPPTLEEAEGLRARIAAEPARVDLRRELVELAFAIGDRELLISSLLGLGRTLLASDRDGAMEAFRQVLQLDPRNPGALDAISADAAAPGPAAPEPSLPAAGVPPAPEGSDWVDFGSLVLDEEGEKTTRWTVGFEAPSGDEQADFTRMLARFKEKVSTNLEVDDARSLYDLGAAYREMGLLEEAIGMFQKALRASPSMLAAYEMLGQCFLDRGEAHAAVRVLRRSLEVPIQVEDDLVGIYYFLAKAHEEAGHAADAREFYEKVFSLDINFMDVTDRLRALR